MEGQPGDLGVALFLLHSTGFVFLILSTEQYLPAKDWKKENPHSPAVFYNSYSKKIQ